MAQHRSAFCEKCKFKDACEDFRWLCFWPVWLALLGVVGVIIFALVVGI